MAQFDGNPRDNRRANRAIQRAFKQLDSQESSIASQAMLFGGAGTSDLSSDAGLKSLLEESKRYALMLGGS